MDGAKFFALVVITVGSISFDFSFLHGQNVDPAGCEPLSVSTCMDFGYESTYLPNLLGQTSQDVAAASISNLTHVLDTMTDEQCRNYTQHFLCSNYLPECIMAPGNDSGDVPSPLKPCKDFCSFVLTRCFEEIALNVPTHLLICDELPTVDCLDPRNNTSASITEYPEHDQVTGNTQHGQCQETLTALCIDSIGYNQTVFPNYFGKNFTHKKILTMCKLKSFPV